MLFRSRALLKIIFTPQAMSSRVVVVVAAAAAAVFTEIKDEEEQTRLLLPISSGTDHGR
jgi:hypothetical protein